MPSAVVCDDDRGTRRVTAALAADVGLDVVAEVDGGYDLTQLILLRPPDVLILDCVLGSSDGLELLPGLLEAAPAMRVVVFSGYPELRDRAMDAGAHSFVAKPDVEKLQQALVEASES